MQKLVYPILPNYVLLCLLRVLVKRKENTLILSIIVSIKLNSSLRQMTFLDKLSNLIKMYIFEQKSEQVLCLVSRSMLTMLLWLLIAETRG